MVCIPALAFGLSRQTVNRFFYLYILVWRNLNFQLSNLELILDFFSSKFIFQSLLLNR